MLPSRLPSFWFLLLLGCAALAGRAVAQCAPEWQPGEPLPQLRGTVYATQAWDPDGAGPSPTVLVVSGFFDAGALIDTNLATWDGTQWGALPGAPAGEFRAMCLWNGQLALAGPAVWTCDGTTWTNRGAVTGGTANAITSYLNDLVVVGSFTSVGGWPTSRVAAYAGAGWVALGAGVTGTPRCAVFYGGLLHVGGDLVPGGGTAAANLQVWNGSTWSPLGLWNGPIETLAVRTSTALINTYLYAGGSFTLINGTLSAPLVARYSVTANAWIAQGLLAVASGATNCSRLFVRHFGVNSFELTAGVAVASDELCWRWTGTTWTSLGTVPAGGAAPSAPTAITWFGGSYLLGIQVGYPYGETGMFRLGTSWTALLGPGSNAYAYTVGANGGEAVVAGTFAAFGGVAANGIVRGRPGNWSALGSGLAGGQCYAVASLPNGDLVAGGAFLDAGGVAVGRIARWDGTAWHGLGSGVDAAVIDLAVLPNGDVLAAGSFTVAGGVLANRVARWDGTAWHALGGGVDDELNSVAVLPNGDIVVGGIFTTAGGSPASRIARWDGVAWHPLGSGLPGTVYSLAVAPDGDLWVCGNFRFAGGVPAPRLARWDGTGWHATPPPPPGQWSTDLLDVTVLPNGTVLAGGYLQNAGPGVAASALWRLDGGTWQSLAVDGTVLELAVGAAGEVFVVGTFDRTGGATAISFGELRPTCPASAVAYGSGCTGAGGPNTLTATTLPWDASTFRSRATGMPANGVAVVVFGFTPISVPMAALLPEGLPGCDLLASLEITAFGVPTAGVFDTEVFFAPAPSLIGQTLYHQIGAVEVTGSQVTAISTTNGLALTVGSY